MKRERLFELAEKAKFLRVKPCCGVDLKLCNGDIWQGQLEALAKAIEFEARHTLPDAAYLEYENNRLKEK